MRWLHADDLNPEGALLAGGQGKGAAPGGDAAIPSWPRTVCRQMRDCGNALAHTLIVKITLVLNLHVTGKDAKVPSIIIW